MKTQLVRSSIHCDFKNMVVTYIIAFNTKDDCTLVKRMLKGDTSQGSWTLIEGGKFFCVWVTQDMTGRILVTLGRMY